MMTKTIRSPFDHEVGGKVEGFTILEKRVVIAPNPAERRRGIYDYLVEVPPAVMKSRSAAREPARKRGSEPSNGSVTRATPEEMLGTVIRRINPR
jgi:hypothetical protein